MIVTINLGPLLLLVLVALALLLLIKFLRRKSWKVVKGKIKIGDIGEIEIQPNDAVIQLAHRAWVELMTRKVGITFEPGRDVIVEVYDSWYACFRELRTIMKEVPADSIKDNRDTAILIETLVTVLNRGMRPHLTKWQAKFRRWYEGALKSEANSALSPQEIQERYPEYKLLVSELTDLSEGLRQFAEVLREIAAKER